MSSYQGGLFVFALGALALASMKECAAAAGRRSTSQRVTLVDGAMPAQCHDGADQLTTVQAAGMPSSSAVSVDACCGLPAPLDRK